jgi:YspA, cpYpsA-related SLOG family
VKVLVCGSRTWTNRAIILRELATLPEHSIVVHGGAPGADSLAGEVARDLGFEVRVYPADWNRFSFSAGPIRNSEILAREHPDKDGVPIARVYAFARVLTKAASPGTWDMTRKAIARGIDVREVGE